MSLVSFFRSLITARKQSCGKVMFLHLSVSHSVHGGCMAGGGHTWQGGMHGRGACVAGKGMHGGGGGWRGDRRPLKWAVCIRLECILSFHHQPAFMSKFLQTLFTVCRSRENNMKTVHYKTCITCFF